eukprot:4248578-Pleurochrysis_carterae.AAC.1
MATGAGAKLVQGATGDAGDASGDALDTASRRRGVPSRPPSASQYCLPRTGRRAGAEEAARQAPPVLLTGGEAPRRLQQARQQFRHQRRARAPHLPRRKSGCRRAHR